MRTNIVIDDALIEKALQLCGVTTKREVVHLALLELVRNRERKDLRELRGKVSFRDDYDYKALRESKTP
jgi:Arc/MetJ family transcription regulator